MDASSKDSTGKVLGHQLGERLHGHTWALGGSGRGARAGEGGVHQPSFSSPPDCWEPWEPKAINQGPAENRAFVSLNAGCGSPGLRLVKTIQVSAGPWLAVAAAGSGPSWLEGRRQAALLHPSPIHPSIMKASPPDSLPPPLPPAPPPSPVTVCFAAAKGDAKSSRPFLSMSC